MKPERFQIWKEHTDSRLRSNNTASCHFYRLEIELVARFLCLTGSPSEFRTNHSHKKGLNSHSRSLILRQTKHAVRQVSTSSSKQATKWHKRSYREPNQPRNGYEGEERKERLLQKLGWQI
ncbi:hypothetical protein M9H77_08571 [Catharanthus roseus]|uniref:Uncharacterized protein n=1 Tax=Catharanthus roseus TaxID=4058 RepID=A0ACC0BYJ3_CATRO|nr:hypothetical protein M9H77_08571 [Catharanthus roseus]